MYYLCTRDIGMLYYTVVPIVEYPYELQINTNILPMTSQK